MYQYYFTFRSMTQAQRAVGLLRQAGIFPTLLRTPRAISSQGCGYSILVRGEEVYQTAAALRAGLVLYEKAYRMSAGGRAEEVFP